ncbi:hypothetical protein CAEBREN_31136 [Caenorhabditis brenneri]|uniref:Protein kinase domain-containing protein n=1 Tax=Caenorhabditis brenneri TaxID=135651 RepID=G0MM88_CAEBE|nr:hypothetical protein CAEBREN_31136 [Caenorhabditis brenneri]
MYPNSKIEFNQKTGGTRTGIVVVITYENEKATYYMKTYHHAGSSMSIQNMAGRKTPDLREMFAYRFLEVIGVGPTVYFPYYDGSKFIHYIATKEVMQFTMFNDIKDLGLKKKVVVESYLLSLLIGVRDLNEGNIGSNEDSTVSIIDFYVTDKDNFVEPDIINTFKNKSRFGGEGTAADVLVEIGPEERMSIVKDAVTQWSMIKEMTTDIIDQEKTELKAHGIEFGTVTNDVESYLRDIKLNYETICSAFE